MNILYDSAMPFAEEFFDGLGNIDSFTVGNLTEEALAGADVLLVRSTTNINRTLLSKAPNLKFVGTATAGFDHFDIQAIDEADIKWTAAPGCNARAVAEYVCCALLTNANGNATELKGKTIGIVGVGDVGFRVAKIASGLGMQTVLYDPPKANADTSFQSDTFEQLLTADVISLHVPLTKGGKYPTFHLFNNEVLQGISKHQVLINACRGDVVDEKALLDFCKDVTLITDCWSEEPVINKHIMHKSKIATAHIAGHSLEGKARGTEILYQRLCKALGKTINKELSDYLPKMTSTPALAEAISTINSQGVSLSNSLALCKCFYDVQIDDERFREYMINNDSISNYRKYYPIRREFDAISLDVQDSDAVEQLLNLGFSVNN